MFQCELLKHFAFNMDRMKLKSVKISLSAAQFLADTGRLMESADMYLKYVAENPDHFELVFNAANVLRQIQKNKEAEALFMKATQLKPEVGVPYFTLNAG